MIFTTQPPLADAGPDQSVSAGSTVNLDGGASSDADGSIGAYRWLQASGTAVSLSNAGEAIASFIAPAVVAPSTLTFELTVTDDQGASAKDSVDVTVYPAGFDIEPPITTLVASKYRVKGVVSYKVSLSTNEPATSHFRVTGQGTVIEGGEASAQWQAYAGPLDIQLDKRGSVTVEYYSIDQAGNQEVTKSEVLQ